MPEMPKRDGQGETESYTESGEEEAKGGEKMRHNRKSKLFVIAFGEEMIKCCATCDFCKYIKVPQVTGNPVDYVCEKRGAVIADVTRKECDDLFRERKAAKK